MRPDRHFYLAFALGLSHLISNPSLAGSGNPESGKQLFEKCRPCHGRNGNPALHANSPVPLLGGQHSEYIVMALNGYAGGSRNHAGMKSMVEGMSATQKQDIGSYLAQFELKIFPIPNSGPRSEIEKKIENCRSCHGERGNSFSTQYPRIIGQNRDYLIKVLEDYKNQLRKNPTMIYVMRNLSDKDLNRIADYYSSQPDGLNTVP